MVIDVGFRSSLVCHPERIEGSVPEVLGQGIDLGLGGTFCEVELKGFNLPHSVRHVPGSMRLAQLPKEPKSNESRVDALGSIPHTRNGI